MSAQPKTRPNWSLLMPATLLLVEVVAIIFMRVKGYEITHFVLYFFIALATFLVYQLGKRLISFLRVTSAMRKIHSVDKLIESGQSMAAIKQSKNLLLNLPETEYLEILNRMTRIYENEQMFEAANQVRFVQAESIEFFRAISRANTNRMFNLQEWKNRVVALRVMIRELPEEKE